jgi:DNA-binding response OmpR family regulator
LAPPARVLIVDRSKESRDVLRSLLTHRGAEVLEAPETASAAAMAVAAPPDLIVVDVDPPHATERGGDARLADVAARNAVPIVVVGTVRRIASPLPVDQFIAKPYHYGALIRRIEELLGPRN